VVKAVERWTPPKGVGGGKDKESGLISRIPKETCLREAVKVKYTTRTIWHLSAILPSLNLGELMAMSIGDSRYILGRAPESVLPMKCSTMACLQLA
jgi:hypothetical protein